MVSQDKILIKMLKTNLYSQKLLLIYREKFIFIKDYRYKLIMFNGKKIYR